MASLPVTSTPMDIVAGLSLTVDTEHYIQRSGDVARFRDVAVRQFWPEIGGFFGHRIPQRDSFSPH